MTPEGALKCMVGGRNYVQSQFNRATQAVRQAGSAFSLFVYLAALDRGVSVTAMLSDRSVRIGRWKQKNYHWQSCGEIRFADQIAYSVNNAQVSIEDYAGKNKITYAAKPYA